MQLGAAVVRAGAVGWVATHPEHRRRGLASMLLEDWTRELTERGEQLSFLTGIAGFYEQFGYEPAFRGGCAASFAPGPRRPHSRDLRPSPFRPTALEQLAALYDSENALRVGSLVRTPGYWEWLLAGLDASGRIRYEDVWLAETRGGRVDGYAMTHATPERCLEVWEASAREGRASALLETIAERAREEGCVRVDLLLPLDHALVRVATARGARPAANGYGIHARILDLEGLFSALRPELRRRLRSSSQCDWQGTLRAVTDIGTVEVAVSDGEVAVGESIGPLHVLELPQALLVQLVTGYAAVTDVGVAVEPSSLPVLEALFPRGYPYIWSADVGY